MKKCFYSLLEVKREATFIEIKKSYRKLVVKYHPDRNNGSKVCEEKIKEINEAYEHLSDTRKRAIYDERHPVNTYQHAPKKNVPSAPTIHEINITLEESYFGCTKQINVVDIYQQDRVFTITVPRGVSTNQLLTVTGNSQVVDFFIKIRVAQHYFFNREGADLHCTVTVPYIVHLDGGQVSIPWFNGTYKINLNRGVHYNDDILLPGMGMPIPDTNSTGNLYVTVRVRGLVDFSSALLEEPMFA